jgi:glutamate carboxypeptidase
MVHRLADLVNHESPAGEVGYLADCAELLSAWGGEVFGRPPQWILTDGLPHLLWAASDQRVLLLGHYDTVWPAGTLADWPFSIEAGIASGPGVCDMKAGIVQMFAALRNVADISRVGVLLTCDEEHGSVTSRELIERQAGRSGAVLVCEPSTPPGALKIARRGGSAYRLNVQGRAAHAGIDPHRGVNATVEVAHQVLALRSLGAATSDGTSVTPTTLSAGTTSNTVPEQATVCVDVRAWTRDELDRIDQVIRGLTPHHPEAVLTVAGGVNRYPLTTDATMRLYELARLAAAEAGLPVPAADHAPGASDANFTGALGVATLDGLGAVGGNAHARGEYVEVDRMSERSALLAALIDRLVPAPAAVITAPGPRAPQ